MTVKELFQSLDFNEIIKPLVRKYPNALKSLSEYKENYDIILNTTFSGEGGTITFHPDGDSDSYMVEGDRYFNIVGMDVILPENGAVTKAEAAAEILWCAAPFGRYPVIDWGDLFEEDKADYYALQAKRIGIKMAFPYCRDKNILQELKREMQSSSEDLCLSADASDWFLFGKGKLWGKKHNRSKRKRLYRMKKRNEELLRLSDLNKQINLLETKIGPISEHLRQLILTSSFIKVISYESQTEGKSDRIDYLKDLLINPLYNSNKFLKPDKKQECICVLYSTPDHPCSEAEQKQIVEILTKYFNNTTWQLYTKLCNGLNHEVELDITYITV